MEPQLTTIWQDTEQIGKKAAESLISLIEHPKTTLVQQILVQGEVFEGKSVRSIDVTPK